MNAYVGSMAVMRIISGVIELTAATLMIRANQVDTALRINALLGFVGPTVLTLVSFIGLAGLAAEISPGRMLLTIAGIFLILLGTRG